MDRKKPCIGILRETKTPPDRRVPLSPPHILEAKERFPGIEFKIQPSPIRCYSDDEYNYLKLPLEEDLSQCDILMGVKEVNKSTFIEGKTYVFFSHVAKKQPYNREMLLEMMRKRITLIDYEYLTKPDGQRVVAFGHWAGIVGAYNALRARGIRNDSFRLKPAHQCHDMDEMFAGLRKVKLQKKKILVTGEGRVAQGALETLGQLEIKKVTKDEFLNHDFDEPVLCQIGPQDYVEHKDGLPFDFNHFIQHPQDYRSVFEPFSKVTDILVACHFWDEKSPHFLTKDDYRSPEFRISVIADVSCDIGGPIPSTLRASTISEPFYGYSPTQEGEQPAFTNPENITVMAVDNLPGEVPRDASAGFGEALINNVFESLVGTDEEQILERATILKDGELTSRYAYMADYVAGK
jgi:saccharopine dehydrogenase (NAD+, L-lysine-forming)